MDIDGRQTVAVSVVVLVVLGGCVSVGGTGGSGQPTATTVQQHGTPTPVQDGCPSGLAFYGLGSPDDFGWSANEAAVGYTLPPASDALLVAFEGETVLGSVHVSNTNSEHAQATDGHRVPLGEPLDGTHDIRVVAFQDSDGDGQFDPETDAPCRGDDGDLVMTGPERIDFDALQTETAD